MRQPIYLLLLLVSAMSVFGVYAANTPAPKRVRIIFGYENIGQWEQEFTAAIAQVLVADPRVTFYTEYITLNVEDPTSYNLFSAIEQIRPADADAIITVRPEASTFVNQWKDTFFPSLPIVYVAPDNNIVTGDLSPEIEFIVPSGFETSVRDTLEFLPKVLLGLEHIYIFSGDSAADASYLARIQSVIQEAGLPQTIHYLVGLMPSEISAALNVAPENTAAVFGLYTRDKTGQQLRTGEVVNFVSGQTDIPLFGLFVSTLNSGITGVNVTSPAAYAKRTADLTLALLFDNRPPTDSEIPTRFFFNAAQLDHFGIDRDLLPEGSEVTNDNPSLFQQYRWQFALGGTVFMIQLVFIMALWRSLRRRNKAEAERERSSAAMIEAQRIAHVGSWQLDLVSSQVTWTPELYLMQGLDPDSPPPDYTEYSKLFTPASWERLSSSMSHTIESGNPYELELETVKPDGKHGWMLAKGEVVRDERGSITGVRGTALDTSERHAINEQLRRSQKMEAVGQLTGGIAHDFNNILAIIMGNLELIQLGAAGDKKILSGVDRALKGATRGAVLIDKLLGFSRIHINEMSPTSVNQSVENMDGLLTKSLMVSIEVETQLAPDLWSVNVDAGDLEDAILNLVLNARDAMPDGGRLSIGTENKVLDADFVRMQPESRIGDYAMLSIIDNGRGMRPEVREKVLEPFFTTKSEGQGTGLGLSMVYGFVKRSGGFITIVSEPGVGTSINLFLPRGGKADQVETSNAKKEELPRGDETVLVVDDEEELAKLAAANLERLGYKVLTAFDGKSALTLIEDEPNIDLLFCDVIMPGELDGYRLSITAKKTHPALKLLLTSGFTKGKEDDSSPDNSMYEDLTRNLLRKPYSRVELVKAVRKALDERPTPE
jgi:signal transduction histidine kinase